MGGEDFVGDERLEEGCCAGDEWDAADFEDGGGERANDVEHVRGQCDRDRQRWGVCGVVPEVVVLVRGVVVRCFGERRGAERARWNEAFEELPFRAEFGWGDGGADFGRGGRGEGVCAALV